MRALRLGWLFIPLTTRIDGASRLPPESALWKEANARLRRQPNPGRPYLSIAIYCNDQSVGAGSFAMMASHGIGDKTGQLLRPLQVFQESGQNRLTDKSVVDLFFDSRRYLQAAL
jgi:hypothetical protein